MTFTTRHTKRWNTYLRNLGKEEEYRLKTNIGVGYPKWNKWSSQPKERVAYVEQLYRRQDNNGEVHDDLEEVWIWERENIGPEVLGEESGLTRELKSHNAEGIEYMATEMLKSLEEGAMKELIWILQDIYIQRKYGRKTSYTQHLPVNLKEAPHEFS